MNKPLQVLDTTLRDGSYVIDFQFTSKDTAVIASQLDAAGLHFIEVGHGLGLRAGTKPGMIQPEADEAYLEAAASTVHKAKWGMFFIPGIGTLEDIDTAARYGMSFIRVGTNVTEVESSEKYIRRAREHGMFVFANYMKTYALSPDEVGRKAAISESYGAQLACIVDSAGGMFPHDVKAYFDSIRKYTTIDIGFHGHNNMGMANANSLLAAELGAAVVDTSVRGMGRSAGNAVTEIFLLSLKRKGIDLGINIKSIFNLAEKYIDPLLKKYNQVDSIGIISGYAQFHSSYLGKVLSYSKKFNIDPKELIVRLTEVDKVNAPDELLERLCDEISRDANSRLVVPELKLQSNAKVDTEQDISEKAAHVALRASHLSKKWASSSVFNIVQGARNDIMSYVSDSINEGYYYSIASAEVYDPASAEAIAWAIDGKIDFVLLDTDIKNQHSRKIHEAVFSTLKITPVLMYSDIDVWTRSVTHFIMQLLGSLVGKKIALAGLSVLRKSIENSLLAFGAVIVENKYDAIVLCGPVKSQALATVHKGIPVVDAWIGSLDNSTINELHQREVQVFRVDMYPFMQAEAFAAVATYRRVNDHLGLRNENGIVLASGGLIAPKDAVIVDSVNQPSRLIGIADGTGKLIVPSDYTELHRQNIKEVEKMILFSVSDINTANG